MPIAAESVVADDYVITYIGGRVHGLCKDCGNPTESPLLRCQECDRKYAKETIPLAPEVPLPHAANGCDLFEDCFECPFPKCRYEVSPRVSKGYRSRLAIQDAARRGLDSAQIAGEVGMSRRGVQQVLRTLALEAAAADAA